MKQQEWLDTGKHLPEFMRDFHDQKDLFKTIHTRIKPEPQIDWIKGQIYTVDVFLHFMARRGYTLQKNRSNVPFRDIEEDIAETMRENTNIMMQALEKP